MNPFTMKIGASYAAMDRILTVSLLLCAQSISVVTLNNQLAIVRSLECCHGKIGDSASLARALQWIIDHHTEHHITTVNLAPVDDQAHADPVATEIDDKLATLRGLGIWVSAPAGNHHFTRGISWPASQPNCFAIGAVIAGKDTATLDRHAKVDLLVPAKATSSSNAIVCGSAMMLREAILKSGYDWKSDGNNIAEAMQKIFQDTGKPVDDPATQRTYRRLDLMAALELVMKKDPVLGKAQIYGNRCHLVGHTMRDLFCVAGESGGRVEPLLALMERGVHVLSERPLVTKLVDLDWLRTAFAKSTSQLTMLLELRHQPKNAPVREIIQRGDIGEVCQVTTQKSYKWGERAEWFKSRARLGGTIPYIGIHSLDTIRWVTGLDFIQLAAIHGKIGRPEMGETECHASVLGELSNGASVTARIDDLRPAEAAGHGDDRLSVAGTKGVVEVNEGDATISLITGDKTERVAFGETENLFVEFVKFLRGGAVPRITADDCFRSTEIVLRAREAADETKMIALPPMHPVRGLK